jgi:hypothetical protein
VSPVTDDTTRANADEIERALSLLIHDLRTPLGVALGYVRLIKDERLGTPAEREKALSRAIAALGTMWRLCEDADGFLAHHAEMQRTPLPPRTLVDRLSGLLGTARVQHPANGIRERRTLLSRAGSGELAQAIECAASVLARSGTDGASSEPITFVVSESDGELQLFARRGAPAADMPEFDTMVDPWRKGYGLSLPLACHVIAQAGGRLRTASSAPGTVLISFPVEDVTA